jgi:HPt (histidine-containing phosphotransfer) domain-containing protein
MREYATAVAQPEDRSDASAGADAGQEAPEELAAVDVTVIEQLASITDDQGFSVLGELLNAFLTNVPGRLDALEHAVAAEDMGGLGEQAHTLTGSAASFGARGMADLCRELRVAAARGDVATGDRLVRALRVEFARVQAWLMDFRGIR